MIQRLFKFLPLLLFFCITSGSCYAQREIVAEVTPSGAGTIGNSRFSLTATIGQPVAGTSALGNRRVNVGFAFFDQFEPVAICRNVGLRLVSGTVTLTLEAADNGSFDNVGIAERSLSKTTFTSADLGENQVELTITDYSGLSDSCTFTVTVVDENSSSSLWMFSGN